MVSSGVVAAIHVAGVRCGPCGAMQRIDYYLFIKYYFPLHISSLKCSSSGGYSCIHTAYGSHSLRESWWSVGIHLCTDRPTRTVTVPNAACIQLYSPEDEHLKLETFRGKKYFMNK